MFGLSMTEVVIILGLALLLLGPDQLPSIAKTLGKGMREIRKATDDLKSTFEQEMVRFDEPELQQPQQRMLQPVSADPAAARASARAAAAAPAAPPDPGAARAAARRTAAGPDATAAAAPAPDAPPAGEAGPALHLVPPEGSVAREAGASDAPAAPPADAVKDAK